MSSPDMTNPQVQRNLLLSRMREGKGKFVVRKEVLVFKDENGIETIPPVSVSKDIMKQEGIVLEYEKTEVVPTAPQIESPVETTQVEEPKEEEKPVAKPRGRKPSVEKQKEEAPQSPSSQEK